VAFVDDHARPDSPPLSDADDSAAGMLGHALDVSLDLVE
jgi:hypothetical protein